eukprot:m.62249 g.62249  ORF g.62249 m.62249 type:complete len:94 (+) comp35048_c1_seq7:237-518(+)
MYNSWFWKLLDSKLLYAVAYAVAFHYTTTLRGNELPMLTTERFACRYALPSPLQFGEQRLEITAQPVPWTAGSGTVWAIERAAILLQWRFNSL